MSNRKIKVLIIGSAVILCSLMVGGFFTWKRRNLTKNSGSDGNFHNPSNQKTPPPPENDNPKDKEKNSVNKKGLANKIKTDLKERINRIKNSKSKPDSSDWAPYVIFKDKIACQVVGGIGFLKEREGFSPTDVGSENYQEIINLIKQARDEFWVEWINRRNQEYQQKVANNPNLFYCPTKSTFDSSEFFETKQLIEV